MTQQLVGLHTAANCCTSECASYMPQHRTSVTNPGSSHEATLVCIVSCRSVSRLSSWTVHSSAVSICEVKDCLVVFLILNLQSLFWHYRFFFTLLARYLDYCTLPQVSPLQSFRTPTGEPGPAYAITSSFQRPSECRSYQINL